MSSLDPRESQGTKKRTVRSLFLRRTTHFEPGAPLPIVGPRTAPPVLSKARQHFSFGPEHERSPLQELNRRGSFGTLEEIVTCPVCLEKLTSPRMLPCQHTFCLSCLQSIHKPAVKSLTCPLCQKTVGLAIASDLSNLPCNLYIDSLLRLVESGEPGVVDSVSRLSHTQVQDGGEEENFRCVQCQTVTDTAGSNKCGHCKQIFCEVCWSAHMEELKLQTRTLATQLEAAAERLDHQVDDIQARFKHLSNTINVKIEEQIIALQEKQNALLKEAQDLENKQRLSAQTLREKIMETCDTVNEKANNFESISDKVSMFLTLHKSAAAILSSVSNLGDDRAVFDQDNLKIEMEVESHEHEVESEEDHVTDELSRQNPLENEETLSHYYRSLSSTPRFFFTKCTRPAGLCPSPWLPQGFYVATTDSRMVMLVDRAKNRIVQRFHHADMLCPQSVCVRASEQEIFVTDKWKHCIHVFDREGLYLRCLGTKGHSGGQFQSPEGIAVDKSESLLYVCDTGNDRVQVIDPKDGTRVTQFGPTNTKERSRMMHTFRFTELNSPTGLAVTEDKVIIADSGNRRIKVYTLGGEKLLEFGSMGRHKGQFRSADVVAVDQLGFILVGDSGNARIQIFRPSGSLVRVFAERGSFRWISGICVTPESDIIVSDSRSHTIQMF